MEIRKMKLSELTPAEYNPRVELKPGDQEWEALDESIGNFGYVEPIVWNERTGNIVGGHQRRNVLLARGVEEEDISVVNLSPEDEKILNVLLNKSKGIWDVAKLVALIDEIKAAGGNLKATGFTELEISLMGEDFGHRREEGKRHICCYLHSAGRTAPACEPLRRRLWEGRLGEGRHGQSKGARVMKIIRKRIADMERATYNPRVELQPGDAEYETLRRSLEQFGMVEPVVWNERTNRVVGGHQRLTVEAALGHEEVDVSVVDLDEIKEKELNIALNKIGGRWDTEKLGAVFDSLGDRALETGFTQPEIDEVQAKLEQLIDQGMIDQELAQIEKTFNLSLRFDQHDRDDLEAYIKTHGKDSLVAVILKTVFEEGNNNGV